MICAAAAPFGPTVQPSTAYVQTCLSGSCWAHSWLATASSATTADPAALVSASRYDRARSSAVGGSSSPRAGQSRALTGGTLAGPLVVDRTWSEGASDPGYATVRSS